MLGYWCYHTKVQRDCERSIPYLTEEDILFYFLEQALQQSTETGRFRRLDIVRSSSYLKRMFDMQLALAKNAPR